MLYFFVCCPALNPTRRLTGGVSLKICEKGAVHVLLRNSHWEGSHWDFFTLKFSALGFFTLRSFTLKLFTLRSFTLRLVSCSAAATPPPCVFVRCSPASTLAGLLCCVTNHALKCTCTKRGSLRQNWSQDLRRLPCFCLFLFRVARFLCLFLSSASCLGIFAPIYLQKWLGAYRKGAHPQRRDKSQ